MITKRIFLAALTCDTAGWYAARAQADPPGPGIQWRFYTGAEIGRLAREQLGRGTLLPFAPTDVALKATATALNDPDSTLLFEATLVAEPFVARADALRRSGPGWEVIEVKSAVAPDNDRVKDEYIDDLAYTAFVARASGVAVTRCTLLFLGRDCRLAAPSFTKVDVTDLVVQRVSVFADRSAAIAAACTAVDRPAPALEFVCKRCEFFATECVGQGIPDPLFLLPRLSEKRFEEMKPYQRLSAVPAGANLTAPQHRVFNAIRSRQPLIDQLALAPLKDLVWPVYYLDFEAVAPALPWFTESTPYEVMPFQFSIHVCDRPGHEIAHYEYLAPVGGDWRQALVEALVEQLGDRGSIAVYTNYEQLRLTSMAAAFPQFTAALNGIIARLVDFEPIVRNGYCHPAFLGRTSIKNVLPVVAPELSYGALDVGNGLDAEGLFALMTVGQRDPADHAAFRQQLLTYCKLDTLAMVRLHAALDALIPG
jgi:hypothetical protein